jgi:hypothetical protein
MEGVIVKKIVYVLCFAALIASLVGCGSSGDATSASSGPAISAPVVKQPDMLDHKNFKWGTQPPEWVTMNVDDLEALDKYKDDYVFKFESPIAQNLQGAELWTKNFTANAEIAQQVQNRVQAKFQGAAAGDMNDLGTYMENTVKSLSDASFSGYRQRDNYWVKMRYYKADGNVDNEGFTYLALYTIPRKTLDDLVQKALGSAETAEKPKTENEQRARDIVKKSFEEGI